MAVNSRGKLMETLSNLRGGIQCGHILQIYVWKNKMFIDIN